MEQIKLDVQVRNEVGTRQVKRLRTENFFPGVIYGNEIKATSIKVDRGLYERIQRQHHGERVLYQLSIVQDGKKLSEYYALVKEEQLDPVTDKITHVDFNRILLTEKIEVKVSIMSKGEPIGVKRDGGSLDHVIWELDIICLPTAIPQHLGVEVSHVEIGDAIHVKDITLPEGVITKHDLEAIVFSVSPPMKEELAAAPAEKVEVEVIKEKKEPAAAATTEKKAEVPEKKEEKKEK